MENLETLRLLFESQGVHFREGDLADLDNNDDDQNQNQNHSDRGRSIHAQGNPYPKSTVPP